MPLTAGASGARPARSPFARGVRAGALIFILAACGSTPAMTPEVATTSIASNAAASTLIAWPPSTVVRTPGRSASPGASSPTSTAPMTPPHERTPHERAPHEKAPDEKAPDEKAPDEKAPDEKAPDEKAPQEQPGPSTLSPRTQTSAPTTGLVLPPSQPLTLIIPAIGVSSALIDLGRNSDGTVQVPSLDDPDSPAGWYRGSPTPGALGPSIILGHIDSRQYGPGVFYSLGELKPNNIVEITRADGSVAVFAIDDVRSYPKANFPTLAVYGNLDHAGLRLITCGGQFDPDASSYESNIVAFGSLVSSHKA